MVIPYDETDELFNRIPVDVEFLYVVEAAKKKRQIGERFELKPTKRLQGYVVDNLYVPLPEDWTIKNLINQDVLVIQYPDDTDETMLNNLKEQLADIVGVNVIACSDKIKFMDLERVTI